MKCAAADSFLYHSEILDFRELSLFFIVCKLQRSQKAQNVFNTWMTSLTLHGYNCQLSNSSRLHTLNVSFWSVTLIFYPSYIFFMFFLSQVSYFFFVFGVFNICCSWKFNRLSDTSIQNCLNNTITQTHRSPHSNGGFLFLFKAVLSNVFLSFFTMSINDFFAYFSFVFVSSTECLNC